MQVEKTHGRVGQKIDAKSFRAACREYAHKQVDAQRADFKRLGVLGDWDHPYLTMAPRFEAEQLRAFALIIKNGHVYKGYKPVHWCLNCRSALAEAEVEYEDKTSRACMSASRWSIPPTWTGASASTSAGGRPRPMSRRTRRSRWPFGPPLLGRCRQIAPSQSIRNSTMPWSSSIWARESSGWCWPAN